MDIAETAAAEGGAKPKPPKTILIIVNGRERHAEKGELSFDEVIALAFDPVPTGPNIEFTVTYRRGPKERPQGTLTAGHTVKIKQGMIFNATATDKS
jgi:hypothetical protein